MRMPSKVAPGRSQHLQARRLTRPDLNLRRALRALPQVYLSLLARQVQRQLPTVMSNQFIYHDVLRFLFYMAVPIEGPSGFRPSLVSQLQILQSGETVGNALCFLKRSFFQFKIAQFLQFEDDTAHALFNRLFVGLDDQFGMLRLLVGIIDAREALDRTSVGQFIQTLDIAAATGIDGTADIDLHEVADVLAGPVARFTVR